MNRTFQYERARFRAALFLSLLFGALGLLIIFAYFFGEERKNGNAEAPTGTVVLSLSISAGTGCLAYRQLRRSLQIQDGTLTLGSGFFRNEVDLSEISSIRWRHTPSAAIVLTTHNEQLTIPLDLVPDDRIAVVRYFRENWPEADQENWEQFYKKVVHATFRSTEKAPSSEELAYVYSRSERSREGMAQYADEEAKQRVPDELLSQNERKLKRVCGRCDPEARQTLVDSITDHMRGHTTEITPDFNTQLAGTNDPWVRGIIYCMSNALRESDPDREVYLRNIWNMLNRVRLAEEAELPFYFKVKRKAPPVAVGLSVGCFAAIAVALFFFGISWQLALAWVVVGAAATITLRLLPRSRPFQSRWNHEWLPFESEAKYGQVLSAHPSFEEIKYNPEIIDEWYCPPIWKSIFRFVMWSLFSPLGVLLIALTRPEQITAICNELPEDELGAVEV